MVMADPSDHGHGKNSNTLVILLVLFCTLTSCKLWDVATPQILTLVSKFSKSFTKTTSLSSPLLLTYPHALTCCEALTMSVTGLVWQDPDHNKLGFPVWGDIRAFYLIFSIAQN